MAWQKVSDKLYQLQIDGKYVDINCAFGKTEKVFQAFVGSGGMIDAEGNVTTDIISLVTNFSNVANIMLSSYGPKGEVITEGDCSDLSTSEVIELFQIASDVTETFIKTLSQAREPQAASKVEEKEPKAARKTKD